MAQLMCYRKVLFLSVLLFLFVSVCSSARWSEPQLKSTRLSSSRRRMLEVEKEEQNEKPLKKKTTTQSTKNQTKLIKPTSFSSKNQTKTIKSSINSTKNQTKTIKSSINSTKTVKSNNLSSKNQTKVNSNASSKATPTKIVPKKLNSTTTTSNSKKLNSTTITPKIKKLNSTSNSTKQNPLSSSSKKSLDLVKASNKTRKATATTTKDKDKDKDKQKKTQTHESNRKPTKQAPPSWIMEQEEEEDDEDDLVSEFKDLPNRFHRTLIPDLERISTTSKAYITQANNEMTKGFKPYVGKKYAPTIATIVSSAFVLIPLLLVSLLCNTIKAHFSLQKILIFIQVYLSIYFTILCVTSLVTGVEPLKFLFSTSRSTYVCLQVLQTLGYIFYLLLLVMYLVLVFSTECGLGSKFLGLAQVFVGLAVGLHYYVTVFHRVVLRQPPKSNWKIHGIYAACFLLICLFAGAHRRKKAYVENDGGEGKKN